MHLLLVPKRYRDVIRSFGIWIYLAAFVAFRFPPPLKPSDKAAISRGMSNTALMANVKGRGRYFLMNFLAGKLVRHDLFGSITCLPGLCCAFGTEKVPVQRHLPVLSSPH